MSIVMVVYAAVGMLLYLLTIGSRSTIGGMICFGILFGVFGMLVELFVFPSY